MKYFKAVLITAFILSVGYLVAAYTGMDSILITPDRTGSPDDYSISIQNPIGTVVYQIEENGTVSTATGSQILTGTVDGASSISASSSGITFEGATADADETLLSVEDPTEDITYQLDNIGVAGTYSLLSTGVAPAVTVEVPTNDYSPIVTSRAFEKVWFRESPVYASALPAANTGALAACSTTGNPNIIFSPSWNYTFEYDAKGTVTACGPSWAAATGMGLNSDAAANEGHELGTGITAASRNAFVIGTDPAFYMKVRLSITTVANTDQVYVGFRIAGAYQDADMEAYSDYALIGVGDLADAGAGDFFTRTEINGAGVVATDITDANWTDGQTKTLEVRVSSAGAVTFFIDGVAATGAVAMSFDTGDTVVPMLWFLSDVTGANPAIIVQYWEVGIQ